MQLKNNLITLTVSLGIFIANGSFGHAQSNESLNTNKLEKLEKENQDLRHRLDALENMAKKEGLLSSGDKADPPVSAMSEIQMSGFVTASYFHDSTEPPASNDHKSPGYLWNRVNDSFTLNKVKITLASPTIENNGDKWDAAYRVSLIAGQDAPFVNTSSSKTGFDLLREAYVELNIPIGNGIDVRAGELISLLNYESGDGGAANANFSQGYQWFFTGNPPGAGIQLGYKFTDWLGVKFRVQNGLYAGEVGFGSSKVFMGSIEIKPTKTLWVNLLGFGGRESAPFLQSVWGGEVLAGWQATEQLGFATELDYFNFHNPDTFTPPGNSPVWSVGGWVTYDFTKKIGLALRGEHLDDKDGVDLTADGVGAPAGFLNPNGVGQRVSSVALTLNWKPVPTIKVQPEIRYDHTSWSGGFVDGKQNRFFYGAGISYLF